ncbi:MAG: hypothetical protein GX121_09805 [Ignavibacteria bacterium]|nr:hypothetical protein [Ignavibacteria bacterium]
MDYSNVILICALLALGLFFLGSSGRYKKFQINSFLKAKKKITKRIYEYFGNLFLYFALVNLLFLIPIFEDDKFEIFKYLVYLFGFLLVFGFLREKISPQNKTVVE